ncbi:MAG: hypothetical protein N838_16640 [Thiohalocapsa sp. PB-PSB1]|nr:MAG: hypothetical protein N838_16640 [Thiohalocapsa sp. PB-PSB1]
MLCLAFSGRKNLDTPRILTGPTDSIKNYAIDHEFDIAIDRSVDAFRP